MAGVFDSHGKDLIDYLRNFEGQEIDIQQVMSRFTFDCFGEIAFGRNFATLTDENNSFSRAFNDAQALVANRILFPLYKLLGPFSALLPSEIKLRRAMRILHQTTDEIVRDFRNSGTSGDSGTSGNESLLARFVCESQSDEAIRENVLNFLLVRKIGLIFRRNSNFFVIFCLGGKRHDGDDSDFCSLLH